MTRKRGPRTVRAATRHHFLRNAVRVKARVRFGALTSRFGASGIRGNRLVWGLVLALATIAAILILGPLSSGALPSGGGHPQQFSLWALAIGFAVAELMVVHVHFARNSHSFSLSEVAVVASLFSAGSTQNLLLANVLGIGAVLVIHRRQKAYRLAFNLALLMVTTSLSIWIFEAAGNGDALDPRAWGWAFLAIIVGATTGALGVFAAIACNERTLDLPRLPRIIGIAIVTSAANASLGLVGTILIVVRPPALFLVVIPVTVLFLSYRAYGSERKKHHSMELLYESSAILNKATELDEALVSLLALSRTTFRADIAELLLPGNDDGPTRRTRLGPSEETEVMRGIDRDLNAEPWSEFLQVDSVTLMGRFASGASRQVLELEGLTDAMVTPLTDEGRLLGVLIVADRLGQAGGFDQEDQRLFRLIANQVAVVLENGRLERSLAQLVELEQELSHQANHDPLTGLANRTLFRDRVHTALADRECQSAVVFVDLDDFKTVNDSLGHAAGDRLLSTVADRIRDTVRDGDVTARLGGDEFALLLYDVTGVTEAVEIAERVIAALVEPVNVGSSEVPVHASIGVALSDSTTDVTEILRNADVAMYEAKAHGKGQVQVFEGGMHLEVMQRMELKRDLRRAIEDGNLEIEYQPVINLQTGNISGLEALIRWNHPTRGRVNPGRFIALAEEDGSIVDLGRWVVDDACRQFAQWKRIGVVGPTMTLSVNLSPRQLSHPDLVDDVKQILARHSFDPAVLVIEITESVVIRDAEAGLARLAELKALGLRIAVDDFGTGYSSLSYLQRMPVDIVKIDQSFVEDMGTGGDRAALVKAILRLAQSLDLVAVAEGIETEAQLDRLRELDCPLGQGFLFARPLPVADCERLLTGGTPPGSGVGVRSAKVGALPG